MALRTSLIASVLAAVIAPAARAPTLSIVVPLGFAVSTFATGLQHPTAMAWGPGNRLYVTEDTGLVVVAPRGSHKPLVVARRLRTPLGLTWQDQTLFVSEQGRLTRFRLQGTALTGRHAVVRGLPFGEHQQDNVVLGSDGRLYLGSGSTCDVCRERNRRSATVLSLRPDGSDLRVVASGMRNPFGLAFQPGTGRLYASVNGQDKLGTPTRPEPAEMVVVVRQGAFYGWPRCWPSFQKRRLAGRCSGVTPPAAYLEPHSSADGLAFWRGNLFVALWGQYLSAQHGRTVMRIRLGPGGRATRVTKFASGFDHPLALVVDRSGALLVADWGRGVIYRIQSRGG
ncbi:MAG TPA: PQQ-dependent sugar dehydrogenase [Gaiellaceae bacterium]|nr:PQQ-dependent sugar dehydrogenase [Gaiellaceae bacterium]